MHSSHVAKLAFVVSLVYLFAFGRPYARAVDIERLQYGQQNMHHVTLCAQGDYQAALDYSNGYLAKYPNDLEAYYVKAMAEANLGQLDAAVASIKTSLNKGLTFDRYLAGPRDLFAPLYRHPAFQRLVEKQDVAIVHGPVLGAVTDNSARFWLRAANGKAATITVFTHAIVNGRHVLSDKAAQESVAINPDEDNTAVVDVTGLEPDTQYTYFVAIDGKPAPISPPPTFKTQPTADEAAKFEVVFGGGAGFIPWNERMWTTLDGRRPAAALLLGDNVYIDRPEIPQAQKYCYYRRQSRPEYRRFAAKTPIYAIWDDHDFGTNDCTSSTSLDDPPWKMDVLRVFRQNFVNPFYGSGAKQPGCNFDFAIGDVDFIMLDCRFYRQNPKKVENPTMLGPGQKGWLLDKLKNSKATFKVVASSVPWASGTKPGSKDTWDGFPDERAEIFSFIAKNKIEGVVLISADRHRSDAWKIERPNAYDLYDFSSSKLTNQMSHPLMPGCLFGYNEKCSAGSLLFDTTGDDPTVTYRIIDIDGNIQHSLILKKSQLSF